MVTSGGNIATITWQETAMYLLGGGGECLYYDVLKWKWDAKSTIQHILPGEK